MATWNLFFTSSRNTWFISLVLVINIKKVIRMYSSLNVLKLGEYFKVLLLQIYVLDIETKELQYQIVKILAPTKLQEIDCIAREQS